MLEEASPRAERVRTAEVIAALSLATDLSIGVPLEHGLHSTLFAMRLGERMGVDPDTASQTYYACLLFYIGCTAGAELAAELFGDDDALTTAFSSAAYARLQELQRRFDSDREFQPDRLAPSGPRPSLKLQVPRTERGTSSG